MNPLDEIDGPDDVTSARRLEITRAVEALVFAADEPITARDMGAVWATVSGEDPLSASEVAEAVDALNAAYAGAGHTLRVEAWAGGYRMATTRDIAPYLKVFFQEDRRRRLSRAIMETLAILAYRQPATKPEVDFVRGVDSDYALRRLMEMGFVDVSGRSEAVGRPLLYGTTPQFLETFGLASLDDLPNLREVEELLNDPSFNKERARLLMLSGLDQHGNLEEPTDETTPPEAPSDAHS